MLSASALGPLVVSASAPQAGTPAYLQQAYDLSYLAQTAGSGDTIAIVDAYDDPGAEADLGRYRATFGLPACTTANGCFRKVDQNGGNSYPPVDTGWAVEISLDLAAMSALCPNCRIVLVEANSNSWSDLTTAQAQAASQGANQISDSWGGLDSSVPSGTFSFAGVATVAATGDSGYVGASENQYPASLASVTAAGGTSLTAASDPTSVRGWSEAAWSGAGSGCNLSIAKPVWQTDSGCSGRSYADVSADADPATAIQIYDGAAGGWLVVGGTSLASPLIAAYYAITGANAASPSWAYVNRSLLNDPFSGSNGSCAALIAYVCNAGVGYDGPTGAGSISGAVITGAPGIGGPGAKGSYTQDVTATSAQLQGGVYPNGLDTSVWWEYGPTGAYGQRTAPTDLGAGQAPVMASATLTGLALTSSYHYRLVAQNSLGRTYGYDYTLQTTGPPPTMSATSAVVTGSATATLAATVNAQGTPASYSFAYATTGGHTQTTLGTQVAGTADTPALAQLTGLQANTTYHYTLTVTSAAGSTTSPDQTFLTSPGAPTLSLLNATAVDPQGATTPTPVQTVTATTRRPAQQMSLVKASLHRSTLTLTLRCASGCQLRMQLQLIGGPNRARTLISTTRHMRPRRNLTTLRLRLNPTAVAAIRRTTRPHARLTLSQLRDGSYKPVTVRTLKLPIR
jgi:subtilase family serine protease